MPPPIKIPTSVPIIVEKTLDISPVSGQCCASTHNQSINNNPISTKMLFLCTFNNFFF